MNKFYFSFPPTEISLRVADDIFAVIINSRNLDKIESHRLKVIFSELFIDAYLHCDKDDSTKPIEVIFEINEEEFQAIVRDYRTATCNNKTNSSTDQRLEYGAKNSLADKVESFWDPAGRFCVKVSVKIKNRIESEYMSGAQYY